MVSYYALAQQNQHAVAIDPNFHRVGSYSGSLQSLNSEYSPHRQHIVEVVPYAYQYYVLVLPWVVELLRGTFHHQLMIHLLGYTSASAWIVPSETS